MPLSSRRSSQEHFVGFFAPGARHLVAVDGPLRLRIVTSLTAPVKPGLVTRIVITVPFLNFFPVKDLSLTVPLAFFFVNFLAGHFEPFCLGLHDTVSVDRLGMPLTEKLVNFVALSLAAKRNE